MKIARLGSIKGAAALLMIFALAFGLAGCGKKGDLESPEGKKSDFPRTYPRS